MKKLVVYTKFRVLPNRGHLRWGWGVFFQVGTEGRLNFWLRTFSSSCKAFITSSLRWPWSHPGGGSGGASLVPQTRGSGLTVREPGLGQLRGALDTFAGSWTMEQTVPGLSPPSGSGEKLYQREKRSWGVLMCPLPSVSYFLLKTAGSGWCLFINKH